MNTEILKNFWVLEGPDGSGTTTQLNKIADFLSESGKKVFRTAEPTSSEVGLFLREILSGKIQVPPSTAAYLFAADRNNHLYGKNGILEHLSMGDIVLSDRYLFSSLAYQSMNVPYSTVKLLNSLFPLPEIVIYVDLPAETCMERINSRGEQKEIFERLEIQQKVKEGYERTLKEYESHCKIIRTDGSKSINEVSADVLSSLREVLPDLQLKP